MKKSPEIPSAFIKASYRKLLVVLLFLLGIAFRISPYFEAFQAAEVEDVIARFLVFCFGHGDFLQANLAFDQFPVICGPCTIHGDLPVDTDKNRALDPVKVITLLLILDYELTIHRQEQAV
jgi:hypothetical protein